MKFTSLVLMVLSLATTLPVLSQSHPDFSGVYMPNRGREFPRIPFPRADIPYTEYGQEIKDAYLAEFNSEKDDPAFFCVPPGMPLYMAPGASFPLEVIQREHDITMFFEAYSQYRKIYIEGYPRPEPILHTKMGYSVGHWEGDSLVIETTYLAERTMGRTITSDEATFTERLHVEVGTDGKRRLLSEIVFTDPVIYTEPITMRGSWLETPELPIMEYSCTDAIYDEHIQSVREAAE